MFVFILFFICLFVYFLFYFLFYFFVWFLVVLCLFVVVRYCFFVFFVSFWGRVLRHIILATNFIFQNWGGVFRKLICCITIAERECVEDYNFIEQTCMSVCLCLSLSVSLSYYTLVL